MPNPETGHLAVHVVASDVELDQIQKGGGEAASRRVAEALIFATSMTMLKATGQVSSLTWHLSEMVAEGLFRALVAVCLLHTAPPQNMSAQQFSGML